MAKQVKGLQSRARSREQRKVWVEHWKARVRGEEQEGHAVEALHLDVTHNEDWARISGVVANDRFHKQRCCTSECLRWLPSVRYVDRLTHTQG